MNLARTAKHHRQLGCRGARLEDGDELFCDSLLRSISVPCHRPGDLPTGLSICGTSGKDAGALQAARSIEALLAGY
ncbi:amidase [compost metagenome]